MTPFAEAARNLIHGVRWNWGGLGDRCYFRGKNGDTVFRWRHHGLGMLQTEFSDTLRVHVWHPKLVSPYMKWPRCVHDHRFDITSAVVVGEIIDVPVLVQPVETYHTRYNAKCYEIQHAKAMLGQEAPAVASETHSAFLFDAAADEIGTCRYYEGSEYRIERRRFHTTRVEALAITVIHRSNFDERLARVLCAPDANVDAVSGIVRDDSFEHQDLLREVLREAAAAVKSL